RTAVVAASCGDGAASAELGRRPPANHSRASAFNARPDAALSEKDHPVEGDGRNMIAVPTIAEEINDRFGPAAITQETRDQIPTFWVAKDRLPLVLRFLKEDVDQPYEVLYDLSAIDERMRQHRDRQPASDFTVVYHLLSFERNQYLRIKVA